MPYTAIRMDVDAPETVDWGEFSLMQNKLARVSVSSSSALVSVVLHGLWERAVLSFMKCMNHSKWETVNEIRSLTRWKSR